MMKNRILWILWLLCMALAAVFTGSWIFAAVLLIFFIVAAGSLILGAFCGKKTTASFFLPKAAEQASTFKGKLIVKNQSVLPVFLGKGYIFWKNSYTGEAGKIPFSFSLGSKGKEEIEFQAVSSWCGCINFWVAEWKCSDFFGILSRKKKLEEKGCTVIMPPEQKQDFAFLTREGFDMESFRYSGSRPGEDPGETFDIREYQDGDSIRQIHWKLSGKLDSMMIREKSFPVDDTVLILADSFLDKKDPGVSQTLAEVFSAVLHSFLEQRISCQAGVTDAVSGQIHMQKITTAQDCETMLYLFLRQGGKSHCKVVQEYLKNPGLQNFANYIYLTGNPGEDAQPLKNRGEVTVVCCGMSGTPDQGETITWKFGSQKKNKQEKDTDSCPVCFWKLH